jgi:hypothetical protein
MATADDLKALLATRTGFEVLDLQLSANQLRIVGRVLPNASKHWVLLVHRLLTVSKSSAWKVDISRNYFLRSVGDTERLFYTWRLIFEASNMASQIESIHAAVNSAPRPARVELEEFPLTGADRTHKNGKGAFAAETMPMVAHVAAQARMGGIRT